MFGNTESWFRFFITMISQITCIEVLFGKVLLNKCQVGARIWSENKSSLGVNSAPRVREK